MPVMIGHSVLVGYGVTVPILSDCRLPVLAGNVWTLLILAGYDSTLLNDSTPSVLADNVWTLSHMAGEEGALTTLVYQ